MKTIKYLLGIIAGLVVAVWYLFTRSKSAEALNENLEVGKAANKLDQEAVKNSGLLESEEEKRKELEAKKNEQDHQDSVDFFNNRK